MTAEKKEKPAKKPAFKIPARPALAADKYYEVRQQRLASQKVVDELQEQETALKNFLIDSLPKSDATGIAGKLCRVAVRVKPVPQVQDWDALYTYVKKHNAFELLQRRLSATAVKERLDDGKTIPGVGVFDVVELSVSKL